MPGTTQEIGHGVAGVREALATGIGHGAVTLDIADDLPGTF